MPNKDDVTSKIVTLWFQGMSPEEKDNFKTLLLNRYQDIILLKIKEIVSKKRISLETSERNPEIYESASWSFKQAHNNGARQMLKMVEDLLAFTE